jgi:hypothetical protein
MGTGWLSAAVLLAALQRGAGQTATPTRSPTGTRTSSATPSPSCLPPAGLPGCDPQWWERVGTTAFLSNEVYDVW